MGLVECGAQSSGLPLRAAPLLGKSNLAASHARKELGFRATARSTISLAVSKSPEKEAVARPSMLNAKVVVPVDTECQPEKPQSFCNFRLRIGRPSLTLHFGGGSPLQGSQQSRTEGQSPMRERQAEGSRPIRPGSMTGGVVLEDKGHRR